MLTSYHGTYAHLVPCILKNGFRCRRNEEHWLGNGIYFFLDIELAKWWATGPTKSFGSLSMNNSLKSGNNKPAIIKALIDSNDVNTIDTRNLEHYQWLIDLYPDFEAAMKEKNPHFEKVDCRKKRCAFFDWLHSEYPIDIVIAGFIKMKKDNYDKISPLYYNFRIPYIEYQLCVFDTGLIKSIERVDLK